ncbi:MAG: hypothetical protein HYY93_06960 [Planctomycetes bacterium]|nr:hypothetical protein [Planctomycetota bacterium]
MAGTPDERLAFVQCLISVAAMDRKIAKPEDDIIQRYVKEFELPPLGKPDYKVYEIQKIPGRIRTPILKAAVVREMQNVAQADGTFRGEERGLIEFLRHAWGLPTPAGVPDGVPGTPAQLKALESRYMMKLDRANKALLEAERSAKDEQIATMRAKRAAGGPNPILIVLLLAVVGAVAYYFGTRERSETGRSGAIRGGGSGDARKPDMQEYLVAIDRVFGDAANPSTPMSIDDILLRLEAVKLEKKSPPKPVPKDIYTEMCDEQARVPTLRREVETLRGKFRDQRVDVAGATRYLNEIWTLGPVLDHRIRAIRQRAAGDPTVMIDLGVPVNRTERGRALATYLEETFPKTTREIRDGFDDVTTYILDWQAIYLGNRAFAVDFYDFPELASAQFVPVLKQSPFALGGTIISSLRLINRSGVLVSNPHGTVTLLLKEGIAEKRVQERFAVMWVRDEGFIALEGLSIPPSQLKAVSLDIWTDARKCEKDFDARDLQTEK